MMEPHPSLNNQIPGNPPGQTENLQKQALDRAGLLKITQLVFPEILSCNLTQNTCEVIKGIRGEPYTDNMDELLDAALEHILPQDWEVFKQKLFRKNLLAAIERGEKKIQVTYRQRLPHEESWHWMETTVLPQEALYGSDILVFAASRNVDEEKEREARLQELVRQREEELRITMTQMGSHISYYDIATSTLTTLPQSARLFGIPAVMENYPESLLANPPAGYPVSTGNILRDFMAAIRRGDPTGSCDYPTVTADGHRIWLHREFATIFDDQGNPVRAVITSDDVTEEYEQTRHKETNLSGLLQITHLVFPQILSCNLTQNTCEVLQSVTGTPQTVDLDLFLNIVLEEIAPEDQEAFRLQFFREPQLKAIAGGRQRFQLTYRRKTAAGGWSWIETTALCHSSPHSDDIMSFAVSRNVDQQKQREEQLQQALAESIDKFDGWHYYNRLINLTYAGLTYVHYLDGSPSPYIVGTLAQRLGCPEKELVLGTCFRIPIEDKDAVQRTFEQARRAGKKSFQADYRVETDRGEVIWIHNRATQFVDKQGSTGYIHFLTDATYEHTLMEERLKESKQVFDIVAQHSNRILYAYDLASRTTRPWNAESEAADELRHLYTGTYTDEEGIRQNKAIMPESVQDTVRFFHDIHSGVPSGELNIHVRMENETRRWYHFKYSSIFREGKPVTALISVEDITQRHEHELAYLRHTQSAERDAEMCLVYLEGCLHCNKIERLSGQLLTEAEIRGQHLYSDFQKEILDPRLAFEDPDEASLYFTAESLLAQYARGYRQLESKWRIRMRDGSRRWLGIETILAADPFDHHIKVVIRAMDITKEQEERLSLRQQADYDAMTGLLRRDAGERQIREYLSAHKSPGGILIILDLDDLKGINDTLGHACGDKAITGIADVMKDHFRADDLLVRFGGDEFIAFLPGTEKGVSSVRQSLESLLGKLSMISLGDNNERAVHCSIGCAVELPDTDTFDSLYQRADMALYHVKRSGKNNYAFFEPEMLESNFRFKGTQAPAVIQDAATESESQALLAVMSVQYPGIISFNLTKNQACVLSVGSNVVQVPAPTRIEDFLSHWQKDIHSDDRENILFALSRGSLLALHRQGTQQSKYYYRNREKIGFVRTEVDVRLYTTKDGDLRAFLLFRWDSGSKEEMELQHLNKLLTDPEIPEYEYVCLIDTHSRNYSVFSHDGENSHTIPETADFDDVTRYIRDRFIPPEDRQSYYEAAHLDQVLTQMNHRDGSYCYRYTMTDSATREARFRWYDGNCTELFMTVHKITDKPRPASEMPDAGKE